MIHVHDAIRAHLLARYNKPVTFEELWVSEWSPRFERLMHNRLVLGAFRYGRLKDKKGWDRIEYAKRKLQRYQDTGNLEALVDVANLALLEFEGSTHPKKHFSSMDDTKEHQRKK